MRTCMYCSEVFMEDPAPNTEDEKAALFPLVYFLVVAIVVCGVLLALLAAIVFCSGIWFLTNRYIVQIPIPFQTFLLIGTGPILALLLVGGRLLLGERDPKPATGLKRTARWQRQAIRHRRRIPSAAKT